MRGRRVLVCGVAVLVAAGAWIGCAEWPVETPTAESSSDEGPLELDDGSRVQVHFTERGLVERHQSAIGRPWSQPRVLFDKPGDAECLVELSAYDDVVAVVAHYDSGCNDPASETVIAAVSDGDLADWETHADHNIDGWKRTRFSWSGYRVVFRKEDFEGVHELSWRRSIGFTGPSTS
ncbi:hypothetical protein [Streptomyces sp. NPDC048172]|uniref:hypothetical protein n=1 Tax=Streptomyces sp. NPDC048172 TaxID=3365505 RepID=UPI003711F92C